MIFFPVYIHMGGVVVCSVMMMMTTVPGCLAHYALELYWGMGTLLHQLQMSSRSLPSTGSKIVVMTVLMLGVKVNTSQKSMSTWLTIALSRQSPLWNGSISLAYTAFLRLPGRKPLKKPCSLEHRLVVDSMAAPRTTGSLNGRVASLDL
jgi:uncharacterized membrane protein